MLTRLEPIIFVIIGYYFGRLPAQQNEKTLKNEINRQTQKADAAQHAKEKALQECEMLEEKIKNTKAVLLTSSQGDSGSLSVNGTENKTAKNETIQPFFQSAIKILDS
jgi:hypothetical protein